MGVIERYTLDANILFYAVDTDDRQKHLLAKQIVDSALYADCVMTLQVLGEVYNAISRRRPQHLDRAEELIQLLSGSMPVVRLLRQIWLKQLHSIGKDQSSSGTRCCGRRRAGMDAESS